jgi:hypothetical protein
MELSSLTGGSRTNGEPEVKPNYHNRQAVPPTRLKPSESFSVAGPVACQFSRCMPFGLLGAFGVERLGSIRSNQVMGMTDDSRQAI